MSEAVFFNAVTMGDFISHFTLDTRPTITAAAKGLFSWLNIGGPIAFAPTEISSIIASTEAYEGGNCFIDLPEYNKATSRLGIFRSVITINCETTTRMKKYENPFLTKNEKNFVRFL